MLPVYTLDSSKAHIHSFCKEILSLGASGKKTLLEAVTGICNGMRPGVESAFISSGLPHRNKLLQMVALCWHQEPCYRPRAADCMVLLQDVLGMFGKETISDAIYNLIHAKDCATDAAKSPASHGLEIDLRNLEAVRPQYKTRSTQKTTLEGQILPGIHLESDTHRQEKEAKQKLFASDTPPNTTLEKDPCYKGNCCAILACGRESILSFMTEGRLNHILDVLRSQQILSRMDYETITSFPTVTSRARALLDTCLGLGEKAAQTVVAILSASKCGPLARGLWTKTVN
ncbi:UNVERIFIED_CONTAM: hypothetical protein K2H54_028117 [Gekko kuhli]